MWDKPANPLIESRMAIFVGIGILTSTCISLVICEEKAKPEVVEGVQYGKACSSETLNSLKWIL